LLAKHAYFLTKLDHPVKPCPKLLAIPILLRYILIKKHDKQKIKNKKFQIDGQLVEWGRKEGDDIVKTEMKRPTLATIQSTFSCTLDQNNQQKVYENLVTKLEESTEPNPKNHLDQDSS
jgi:hypothetical protein